MRKILIYQMEEKIIEKFWYLNNRVNIKEFDLKFLFIYTNYQHYFMLTLER